MRNCDNFLSGTVVVNTEDAGMLNWTKSKTQPMTIAPKANVIIYGNRAIKQRGDKYFVISRSKAEVRVIKLDEGRYKVVVSE